MTDRPVLTPVLTAVAPAVWGSTYLVTSELLPPDRPLLASVLRALPAGLLLVLLTRSRLSGSWWAKCVVLGILNIGGFFYFLFVAAYHLPGGVASLVGSIQPIIILVLGFFVFGHRPRPVHFLACGVVMIGVALLVLSPRASLDFTGIMAGLAGAASMATGMILAKKWGRPEGVSTLAFTGWQLTFGGVFLAPLVILNEGLPPALSAVNLIGFAYLCLVGAVLTYVLWFRGIERLPTIAVSFLSFSSPLVATALGLIFRGETLTPAQSAGALAIISAVVLVQVQTVRKPPAETLVNV